MPRLKKKFFQAKTLRKKGLSIREIAEKLQISKSTASSWLRDVEMSEKAVLRLKKRVKGCSVKAAQNKKAKTDSSRREFFKKGIKLFQKGSWQKDACKTAKIFSAILYWCEGGKAGDSHIQFTNSEPELVAAFLKLFRESFDLDETKFRISLHIHSYHSVKKQVSFWSKITKIKEAQFQKPYLKNNSGKRIRENYQGCVNVRYYDAKIAKELIGVSKAFLKIYGGVR